MSARVFAVNRRDLDGYANAVAVSLEPEDAPEVTGRTFEEARDAMVAELERLAAIARRLEEPTP
ncbi:MAG: hypothetical protein IT181_13030 [Acidobacteria bacterium]|nr:hypothetical protein [Acidobacteriota bacterium]